MVQFLHPASDDITLTGVLSALGDPVRLEVVRQIMTCPEGMNCGAAAPCPNLARSTLSNHLRILREAGLIRTCKKGVENISVVRKADLDARFPGLLDRILSL